VQWGGPAPHVLDFTENCEIGVPGGSGGVPGLSYQRLINWGGYENAPGLKAGKGVPRVFGAMSDPPQTPPGPTFHPRDHYFTGFCEIMAIRGSPTPVKRTY